MSFRRSSIILPCVRLDDFPTQLVGDEAAELLAGWTALWHPALLAATGTVPGWHSADNLPDPSELKEELVVLPSASRKRMSADWCSRMRAASPANPPLVEAAASRARTVAAVLRAAELSSDKVAAEVVADFFALGYAHLQVELLTRAMRYTSVLDTDHFAEATIGAARAAVAGDSESLQLELARAFDLLADARNHVYSVDFYIIDLTLTAATTLGEPLRAKLATGSPTNVLITGEMLEKLADEQPQTLKQLRHALELGTAGLVGGFHHSGADTWTPPERVLSEIRCGQEAAREHLQREFEVFGQFEGAFSTLLPQILKRTGFRGALHAAFDGTRLPKSDQCKTWWGTSRATSIEALATPPLDSARPETWLRLAERIGETIARDHVATVLLAGWPGAESEYFGDLRRVARHAPLLGRLVTLEEYFRITREADEWTTFRPREYSFRLGRKSIDDCVDFYRMGLVFEEGYRNARRLLDLSGMEESRSKSTGQESFANSIVINPWNAAGSMYAGCDPLNFDSAKELRARKLLPEVPGCGFASLTNAAGPAPVSLAEGNVLRNEHYELTVSKTAGGIQSLRRYRDRGTRISQRLVWHDARHGDIDGSTMVADRVAITRNDDLVGEITSSGRLLDARDETLAHYTQATRLVRGLSIAIVDVQIDLNRELDGDKWHQYVASRMAWSGDSLGVRRGLQWTAQETAREKIESPEWIEIRDGVGTVTLHALGLPYHRQAGPSWLDTLLVTGSEPSRRFQFALAIDDANPTKTSLGLLTAGRLPTIALASAPTTPTGWFLHVGASNVLLTYVEPLTSPRPGLRVRLLETEGEGTQAKLAAFRPFVTARTTDFRGQPGAVLSISDGRVEFDIEPHGFIQIEAEF